MRPFINTLCWLLLLASSSLAVGEDAPVNVFLRSRTAVPIPTEENTPRIVGGTTVTDGNKYPFYVIPASSGTLCGASLVHEDILVTAAHCTGAFSNRDVYIGTLQRNGTNAKEKLRTTYERAHPNFDANTFKNDIMLVKLSTSSKLKPVVYNTVDSAPATANFVTVIGFGRTDYGGTISSTLQAVSVQVVDHDTCKNAYTQLNKTLQVCAGEAGKDSCQGDSGGPLLSSNGVLMGIVSFGYECAREGYPGVYSRVGGLDDFIRKGICDMSSNPPASCNAPAPAPSTPVTVDSFSCSNALNQCVGSYSTKGTRMYLNKNGVCRNMCVTVFSGLYTSSGWKCGTCQ
jgi:secreted trypsin-like serine protease